MGVQMSGKIFKINNSQTNGNGNINLHRKDGNEISSFIYLVSFAEATNINGKIIYCLSNGLKKCCVFWCDNK